MERNERVYPVVIAPDAKDRMYDHFEFLARLSINAANGLLDALLKDIWNLRTDPFRYPMYDRPYLPVGKYRYILSNKRYRIVYQIIGNQVFVDDIQDCRQGDDKTILNK
ncbi:ParE toxin of type II toxin-antitoxin system, parDE [Acididesulfobacillus acetoxydans]|uniref:ParE toxin of type II toxin-antitoxin system, parDE n=1 Tax=Acididesulfobacillus acetoxydans TaxID=1561005 RepID=A0A8S0Y3A9_9FIRM|nr:type II toxin-antitoxin system RelE/ParE family toxin [Acididesulfobacillus acetoxydans]CAA7601885.1 ParE toxin of type II toxin-antitoxin system, parDE [Acididesulfobacillus acetoxydans]CEJ08271.1 Plasmid stabilisation system protein [Acididesulfobacillus acetoxydans]